MSAEFYIVFDNPAWYEHNRNLIKNYIESLETFAKTVSGNEYWLRGHEAGGAWDYGARIFFRPQDILLEISSHPPSIVNDIRKLNRLIAENTSTEVLDDDGEEIGGYSS